MTTFSLCCVAAVLGAPLVQESVSDSGEGPPDAERPLDAAGPEDLLALVESLRDKSASIRERAAEALEEMARRARERLPGPTGKESITLDVRKKDLGAILRFIGRRVGVEVTLDDELKEAISIQVDTLDWRHTLRVLAEKARCRIVPVRDAVLRFARPEMRVAVPGLEEAMRDPESGVRSRAARALGLIGRPAGKAVPALTTALSDPHREVRQAAAEALGRIGRHLSRPVGEPILISLDVREKKLHDILRFLSRRVRVNIIADRDVDVSGSVTKQVDSLDYRTLLEGLARDADCEVLAVNDRLIRLTRAVSMEEAVTALKKLIEDGDVAKAVARKSLKEIQGVGLQASRAKAISDKRKRAEHEFAKFQASDGKDIEALKRYAKLHVETTDIAPGSCKLCSFNAGLGLARVGTYYRTEILLLNRRPQTDESANRAEIEAEIQETIETMRGYFLESNRHFESYIRQAGAVVLPMAYWRLTDNYVALQDWRRALSYLDLFEQVQPRAEGSDLKLIRRNFQLKLRLQEEEQLESDEPAEKKNAPAEESTPVKNDG